MPLHPLLSYTSALAILVATVAPSSAWASGPFEKEELSLDHTSPKKAEETFSRYDKARLSEKKKLAQELYSIATEEKTDQTIRQKAIHHLSASVDKEIQHLGKLAKNFNEGGQKPQPPSQKAASTSTSTSTSASSSSQKSSSSKSSGSKVPSQPLEKLKKTSPMLSSPKTKISTTPPKPASIASLNLTKRTMDNLYKTAVEASYRKVSNQEIVNAIKKEKSKSRRQGLMQNLRERVQDPHIESKDKIKWLDELMASSEVDFRVLAFNILGQTLSLGTQLNINNITSACVKEITNTDAVNSIRQTCQILANKEDILSPLKAAYLQVQFALGTADISPEEKIKLIEQTKTFLDKNHNDIPLTRTKYLLWKVGELSTSEMLLEWFPLVEKTYGKDFFNVKTFPSRLCSMPHFRGHPRELTLEAIRSQITGKYVSAPKEVLELLGAYMRDEDECSDIRFKAYTLLQDKTGKKGEYILTFEKQQSRNLAFDVDTRFVFLKGFLSHNREKSLGESLIEAALDPSLDAALRLKCVENLKINEYDYSSSKVYVSQQEKQKALLTLISDANLTTAQRYKSIRILWDDNKSFVCRHTLSDSDFSLLQTAMENLFAELNSTLSFDNADIKEHHSTEEDLIKASKLSEELTTAEPGHGKKLLETFAYLSSFGRERKPLPTEQLSKLYENIALLILQVLVRHSTLSSEERMGCLKIILEHKGLSANCKRDSAEIVIDQDPKSLTTARECEDALKLLFEAGGHYREKAIRFIKNHLSSNVVSSPIFGDVYRFIFNSGDKDAQLALIAQVKAKEMVELLDKINLNNWFTSAIPGVAQVAFNACFEYLDSHSFEDPNFKKLLNLSLMFKISDLQDAVQERLYQFILEEKNEAKCEGWMKSLRDSPSNSPVVVSILARVFMSDSFSNKLRMSAYKLLRMLGTSQLGSNKDENIRSIFCSSSSLPVAVIGAPSLGADLRWDIYEEQYQLASNAWDSNLKKANLNAAVFNAEGFSTQQRLTVLTRVDETNFGDISDESFERFVKDSGERANEILALASKMLEQHPRATDKSILGAKLLYQLALQQKVTEEEAGTIATKTLGEYSEGWNGDKKRVRTIQELGYRLMGEIFEQSRQGTNKTHLLNCSKDILKMACNMNSPGRDVITSFRPFVGAALNTLMVEKGREILYQGAQFAGEFFGVPPGDDMTPGDFLEIIEPLLNELKYRRNAINFLKSVSIDPTIEESLRQRALELLVTLSDEDIPLFFSKNSKRLIQDVLDSEGSYSYPEKIIGWLFSSSESELQNAGIDIIIECMSTSLNLVEGQGKSFKNTVSGKSICSRILHQLSEENLINKVADALAQRCKAHKDRGLPPGQILEILLKDYQLWNWDQDQDKFSRSEFTLRFIEQLLKQNALPPTEIPQVITYFLEEPSDIQKITDPIARYELAKGFVLYSGETDYNNLLELALETAPSERLSEVFAPLWQHLREENSEARRSFKNLLESMSRWSDKSEAFRILVRLVGRHEINEVSHQEITGTILTFYGYYARDQYKIYFEGIKDLNTDFISVLYKNDVSDSLKIILARIILDSHDAVETEYGVAINLMEHIALDPDRLPHHRCECIAELLKEESIADEIRAAHLNLLTIFHQDLEVLKKLIDLALSSDCYKEEDEVYQLAIEIKNTLDRGEAHYRYQSLLQSTELPSTAKPLVEEIDSKMVSLNPIYHQLKPIPTKEQKVTFQDFNNLITQIFAEGEASDTIKIKILGELGYYNPELSEADNLATYDGHKDYILERVQNNSFIANLLKDDGQINPSTSAIQLRELIGYLKNFSTDSQKGLSEQSEKSLLLLNDIVTCDPGVMNGIGTSYLLMQQLQGVVLNDENKFKIMDDKALTQKNALDLYRRTFDHFYDVTREAMLDPDQGGTVVRRLLGVERKVTIEEPSHQRLQVRNEIGNIIGAFYVGEKPAFDPFIGCVEPALFASSRDDKAQVFFEETSPTKLIGLWLPQVNNLLRAEYGLKPADQQYVPAAFAILDGREGEWEEGEDGNYYLTSLGLARIMIKADIFQ